MNPVTVMLSTSTPPEPMLEHAIRHRAYELYVQRGMAHGHAVDDWLKGSRTCTRPLIVGFQYAVTRLSHERVRRQTRCLKKPSRLWRYGLADC
jgi:hypothetical protein